MEYYSARRGVAVLPAAWAFDAFTHATCVANFKNAAVKKFGGRCDPAGFARIKGVVRGYHFKGVKPHLFHPWDEALGACFDLRKCYWEEPAALRAQYPGLDPAACGPDALAACRPCFEANMRKAATQRKGWWGGWQPDKGACDAMQRVTDAWRATEKEARAALGGGGSR